MGYSAFVPLLRNSDLLPEALVRRCLDAVAEYELCAASAKRSLGAGGAEEISTVSAIVSLRLGLSDADLSEIDLARQCVVSALQGKTPISSKLAKEVFTPAARPSDLYEVTDDFLAALKNAHRYLSRNCYPPAFEFACWWEEGGSLKWTRPTMGFGALTPYGLSPGNSDLPSELRALAERDHGPAQGAYRIIELAQDIHWLAAATFGRVSPRFKRLALSDSSRAQHLMTIRASQFASQSTKWAMSIQHDHERREWQTASEKLFSLGAINKKRTEQADRWHAIALTHYERLREVAPTESLTSLAQMVAREVRRQTATEVGDRAVYMYLWRSLREQGDDFKEVDAG